MRKLSLFILLGVTLSASAQHWYASPVNNGRDVNCIKLFNRDTVIVAGGWKLADSTRSVFKSDNGGLYLWNVAVDGNQHWIKSMDFTGLNNGIAVCDGGQILYTADAGEHWTFTNGPINRDFNKVFFIDNQNMIIVGGRETASGVSPIQTILKSTNGGQTWSVALDQPGFWLKSVYFPTPTTGYAVGDSSTILKTTNGGVNWSPITAPIQRNFNAIWFTDANNGFIVGGYPARDSIQTILQTTTGGNTWTINKDQPGGMLRDVHFANANTGYAVGDSSAVFKTINGGQLWTPLVIPGSSFNDRFNAVRFYSEDFGYVSGKWGVQYIYNEEPAPGAFTSGAIVDDSLSVTLTGFVNSHDEIAAYSFVFSTNFSTAPVFQTAYAGLIKSNTPSAVQETFTHLLPDTTYYYTLKAWTLGGTVYGDTLSFRTGAAGAQLLTLPATNVSPNSATLHGSISGFSTPMNLFFEYGTTPALGNQIVASPPSISDTSHYFIAANVNSLQNNVIYYFRLKGVGGGNNYFGNMLTFYSGDLQQIFSALQTLPATGIFDTGATINAAIDGFRIPADISFDYSANNTSFNMSTQGFFPVTDTAQHLLTASVSGLTPTTLYYFRVKAQTAIGVFYGDTLNFYSGITGNNAVVHTEAATDVTTVSAELHGEVSGFTEPVDLSFEYGATPAMGSTVAGAPASVSDSVVHTVTAALSALQPDMVYYYRMKAEIASGPAYYGETRQIYTGYNTIPNWDFQYWEQKTYTVPERWNIIGEGFERVAGRSGNYAVKLTNTSLMVQGILYDQGNGPSFIGGVPFHARPDSLAFYANYFVRPGDSAVFLVHLYDTAGNDISTSFNLFTGNSNGQFKRLSFPVTYNSGLIPDSIVLGFVPTIPERGTNGNYLILDDIAAVPASQPVAYGDFESWIDISNNVLLSWFYPTHIVFEGVQPVIITQAIFNPPGDYAVELQNYYLGSGRVAGGEISNKTAVFDKSHGGFPVYARHQTLNGFYKWLPDGNDTMLIAVEMRSQGQVIGQGQLIRAPAEPDFTTFEIPITYTVTGVTPDSAAITIRSFNRNVAREASHLFIDKLSFDGFVGIEENKPVQEHPASIALYPNPASANITIRLSEEIRQGRLTVYDLHGKTIYSKDFSGSNATIDTREFSRGFYLISVEQNGKRLTSRFIVVR